MKISCMNLVTPVRTIDVWDYREHILCYWQLCDEQHILGKTLSKMSPQTRASSSGVALETSSVQNPRTKKESAVVVQEKEEAKEFRGLIGRSMGDLAYDSAVATLRDEETNRRQLKMELRKLMQDPRNDADDIKMFQEDIAAIETRIQTLRSRVESKPTVPQQQQQQD